MDWFAVSSLGEYATPATALGARLFLGTSYGLLDSFPAAIAAGGGFGFQKGLYRVGLGIRLS